MSQIYNDAIFWIEVDKIHPNPYQPRREFDELALKSLADSIRQYGVLQALVVTRKEVEKPDGGLATEYELIAGERRLRASKLAGLTQVPAQVRNGEETDLMKLELAIIENIQREDLNAVDRAKAFDKLAKEFGFKHAEIGKKVGKSREYVSNTLRILMLPDEMLNALAEGKITEGHTRPLMMLVDKPEEQMTLFKEIMFKKINVRDAEGIARRIAFEKARKLMDPDLVDLEDKFKETLGTRVRIEKRDDGGKLTIDFFSKDDLISLLEKLSNEVHVLPDMIASTPTSEVPVPTEEEKEVMSEGSKEAMEASDEDLYSIKNFSV
ncbi:MAG TPA: ParB/RepB/Spo0J family partition protein [Parcubacteria group bacterium]|nr:ParB/RepB/Spo0J family partition protein [Parcubacteria group bacterium]